MNHEQLASCFGSSQKPPQGKDSGGSSVSGKLREDGESGGVTGRRPAGSTRVSQLPQRAPGASFCRETWGEWGKAHTLELPPQGGAAGTRGHQLGEVSPTAHESAARRAGRRRQLDSTGAHREPGACGLSTSTAPAWPQRGV